MHVESAVEAASAAAAASVAVAEASRRYWTRREARQQAAFRRAVQQIVDEALAPIIAKQGVVMARQQEQVRHLDRQDRAIADLKAAVDRQA